MLKDDNAFWRFSLAVYAAPGVTPECLALQESLGADVNVLLFCAWAGTQKRLLTAAHVAAVDARVTSWHEHVVRPLRAARQSIKTMPEMNIGEVALFRKNVAALELRAEQIEQAFLFAGADQLFRSTREAAGPDSIRENVTGYLRAKAAGAAHPAADRLIAAAYSYQNGAA
jgi:uncharacterized protein (TIGR02444 family)